MSFTQPVEGHCPMGCGETLVVLDGRVICSSQNCPRPSAVAEILADPETEHVAEVMEDNFTLLHPLREKLDGSLFECFVYKRLHGLDAPPWPVGRYRVWEEADAGELGLAMEPLS